MTRPSQGLTPDIPRTSFAPVIADGHAFQWLPTGAAAFHAMLQHIAQSRRSIALEFYICKPGAVTDRFRAALIDACRRGVRVQVLLDAFGSDSITAAYWRELERNGGELRWFNPVRLLRLSFRNHRKLLVVDGVTAIVGGMNLADEYDGDGVEEGWRDLALELRGPLVDGLADSFTRMWELAAFGPTQLREFIEARPPLERDHSRPALFLTGPGCRSIDLRRQLHADLREASRVSILAAYFLPSRELGQLLVDVSGRGRVRILMPSISDVPLSQLATEHAKRRFRGGKVECFEYLPQMMHGKLFVIDDIVYVGSANLDVRSKLINFELLLRLPVPALAQQAREIFDADLYYSRLSQESGTSCFQRVLQWAAFWLLARVDPYIASRKLRMLH